VNRRDLLRAGASLSTVGLAGCAAVGADTPPDRETHTGLSQDTSHALEDERVALVGDADALPIPPRRADSLDAASVALATPDADTRPLASTLRRGATVAFAGDGAPAALRDLLEAVGDDYHWGVETVDARPVGVTVAVPRGDAVATVHAVREGGWDDPVLDPLGWALVGRLPECDTFVPEDSTPPQFHDVGSATVVGRLASGETYAARTAGSHARLGDGEHRLRLHSTVHAGATGGYAVESARRVVDLANDATLDEWFPNAHERGGVRVRNRSDPVAERLDVTVSPASDRARAGLTGCCGLRAGGALGYDHRTRFTWRRDRLLGSDSRYGGGVGRGTWHVHP